MSLRDNLLFDMPLESSLNIQQGIGPATFTRASTGTYIDRNDGLVKTAAINEARFETNGILLEGASTNLLLRSEEFDNASWTKFNSATITPNNATAPDGTLTADTINFAADQLSRIEQDVTAQIGVAATTSLYVRAASSENIRISVETISSDILVTTQWQRIDLTQTPTGTTNSVQIRNGSDGVARNIEIWGVHREDLSFSTSYIPTVASTVTRSADRLQIPSSNMPVGGLDFSLSVDVTPLNADFRQVIWASAGEGNSNRLIHLVNESNIDWQAGGLTVESNAATYTTSIARYTTTSESGVEGAIYVDGTKQTDTEIITRTGAPTALWIGSDSTLEDMFGHVRNFRIYNKALTQSEVTEDLTWSIGSPELSGPLTWPLTLSLTSSLTGS